MSSKSSIYYWTIGKTAIHVYRDQMDDVIYIEVGRRRRIALFSRRFPWI